MILVISFLIIFFSVCLFVYLFLISEFSTILTIGNKFISDSDIDLLKKEIKYGWINSIDDRIICMQCQTELNVVAIFDGCHSWKSKYYILSIDNNFIGTYYRVRKNSQIEKVIETAFKTLTHESIPFEK